MIYNSPMMFTCIKVLGCLVVKGVCMCKYESLGLTTSCWVGQDKQGGQKIEASWERAQCNPNTRSGWMYSRGAARDSRSSMYKMYI